jgi:ubiquinone/menaquinone biosynthesis C-methylase UbiE
MKTSTSWDDVADWYHEHLRGEDTYHVKVILPNLLRLMTLKKGEHVLDLACGDGFFSRAFYEAGAQVIGVDISSELIEIAKRNSVKEITYQTSGAHVLDMIKTASIDTAVCILAIQNIAEVKEMLVEMKRILKPEGRFFIVMNHPAYRIPKRSSWGIDEKGKQYRRIDAYMTEMKEAISMHPGKNSDTTVSFHRPLQYYGKLLSNTGLAITRIEEWISHKKSQTGPRSKEEDRMRKEIPLFLCLEVKRA